MPAIHVPANGPRAAGAPEARGAKYLVVRSARWRGRHAGLLCAANTVYPCSLGRAGVSVAKREGDGATPAGAMRIIAGYVRADRLPASLRRGGMSAISRDLGWCEAPGDANYNRPVRLPFAAGRETMWRDDNLYDICLVLDWNFRARARPRGSAIFLHLRRPDGGPTQGCVALARRDLQRLLAAGILGAVLRVVP